ncbi:alpha/beta fold hydrolase [Bacterioplanes sanyensis]|nr:alpha/beta hydrolase [Bacterioplanes sanyensis]
MTTARPNSMPPAAQTLNIRSQDGSEFQAQYWDLPDADTVVHLTHGMAEHVQRYQPLVVALQQAGFAVAMHNHRGHGERTPTGHFADQGQSGWEAVIDDIWQVQQLTRQPRRILFGHSMGSFIAQGFARRHGDHLSGLILSGSNYQGPLLYQAARAVAWTERSLRGDKHPSSLLNALSFASFNRAFRPTSTPFDWLSRDPDEVQAYIQDEHCGHLCSTQLWVELMTGLIEISQADALRAIPSELPVLLIAGDKDPVGQQGRGVKRLAQQFRQTGHHNVTCTLYPDARHEVLNEINAEQVRGDMLRWLQQLDKE